MNPFIQLKKATPAILVVLACFGISPMAQALLPPPAPDGGYDGLNTAEGEGALFSVDVTFGVANTAIGFNALHDNITGQTNTAVGTGALASSNTSANTAIGWAALANSTSGFNNTAVGRGALIDNSNGSNNTAMGTSAMQGNDSGSKNTAIGQAALLQNSNGSNNIAIGNAAGINISGSNNIDIGAFGAIQDSNTIRIGTQNIRYNTYIQGISGVAVIGSQVVVNPKGKLGVTMSSARFKQDIQPMDKASEAIFALKPVTFHYKKEVDSDGIRQFGLVAEQVEKINPDLVARDNQGKVYTVRYEAVNAMLLNEFLKQHRKNEEQEKTIVELKSGMTALAARVKEQASQIQKVSAQLEASKPVPQLVNNP
jgi:hypothetical protein